LIENAGSFFKTGEFAAKCGVTVRTLRFYDRQNLLKPTRRTEAGHRLYSINDMVRLQHILTLKFIGLPLNSIKETLEKNSENFNLLLRKQRKTIEAKIERMQLAVKAIKQAENTFGSLDNLNMENIVKVIKAVQIKNSHEYCSKYFTENQLQIIQENTYEQLDTSHKKWDELVSLAKKLALAGEHPASKAAQEFARRWVGMIHMFTKGDEGAELSFYDMCKSGSGSGQEKRFIGSEVYAFIEKACEVLNKT
jgi:MerR family transcriptional regulator, thiopeptide resistance regulator